MYLHTIGAVHKKKKNVSNIIIIFNFLNSHFSNLLFFYQLWLISIEK